MNKPEDDAEFEREFQEDGSFHSFRFHRSIAAFCSALEAERRLNNVPRLRSNED